MGKCSLLKPASSGQMQNCNIWFFIVVCQFKTEFGGLLWMWKEKGNLKESDRHRDWMQRPEPESGICENRNCCVLQSNRLSCPSSFLNKSCFMAFIEKCIHCHIEWFILFLGHEGTFTYFFYIRKGYVITYTHIMAV